MITEALIVAVGGILIGILLKIKEIYEVWANFASSLRKDKHQHESTVIIELKGHIQRLTTDADNLRASIAYLSHEQLDCSVEEERLWGALNLIHHHVTKQNVEIKELGGTPDEIPSLPPRRQRQKMSAEEFFRRSAQTTARLEEAAASSKSGVNLNDVARTNTSPPSPPESGGTS